MSHFVFGTFYLSLSVLLLTRPNRLALSGAILAMLLALISCMDYDFYYDLTVYRDVIDEMIPMQFEFGWQTLTKIIFNVIHDSTKVLTLVMIINAVLVSLIISKLEIINVAAVAFSMFLLSKWILYLLVVIRFGLASLIFAYACIAEIDEKPSKRFFILSLIACTIHYSIAIALLVYLAIASKEWYVKYGFAFLTSIFLYYIIRINPEVDGRTQRYLDADDQVVMYSWKHFFLMSGFAVVLIKNYFAKGKPIEILALIGLSLANVTLQPFDAVNRLIFLLIIVFLYRSVKARNLMPLTSTYILFLSILFIARYSILAEPDKSLTY
jgi:EpsG family